MKNAIKPCPFCGQHKTLEVISGWELMGEEQEFWTHSDSFAVICSAAKPDGKGGCGATGGFMQTEDAAISTWNTRAEQAPRPAELTDAEIDEITTHCHAGRAYPMDAMMLPILLRRVEARAVLAAQGAKTK